MEQKGHVLVTTAAELDTHPPKLLRLEFSKIVTARPHPLGVTVTTVPCKTRFRLEHVTGADGAERAALLSERVAFLPKRRWSKAHTEMLIDGLTSRKWEALALVEELGGRIISYVDYKPTPKTIEIGFCMTDPDFRRHGLSSRLLGVLVAANLLRDFVVSTYGRNLAMARVLGPLSFEVMRRVPDDRIDGDETLYLRRRAGVPIDLSMRMATKSR